MNHKLTPETISDESRNLMTLNPMMMLVVKKQWEEMNSECCDVVQQRWGSADVKAERQ